MADENKEDKFFYYEEYAKITEELTNEEAGEFIKLLCKYMFGGDEKLQTKTKVNGLFELMSVGINKNEKQASRNKKHFSFYKNYGNVIQRLTNEVAGELIKAVNNYMFKDETTTEFKTKEAGMFFRAMMFSLSKSKTKSENANGKKKTKAVKDKANKQMNFLDKL